MLGAIIAHNVVPCFLKRIFSLEMVKNDICLGGSSKQNATFLKKIAAKNAPMPLMPRIGLVKYTSSATLLEKLVL